MKHHQYNPNYEFVVPPVDFNKYTDRSLLQYCLGATMYMPGTKDFAQAVIDKKYPGLTSMVMCFEDACPEEDVPAAELNSIHVLDTLKEAEDSGKLKYEDIPLLFFRVRSPEQFEHFASMLRPEHIRYITGFNFPKFNGVNGGAYMSHLVELNNKFGEVIYGMPIIEDARVAFKETRLLELMAIKNICDCHKRLILNVRVGGTDFSSVFGVRRGVDYSLYDIMTVRECARIQSFPDWYEIQRKYTTGGQMRKIEVPRYSQVGNAIPPLFAEQAGNVLKQMLQYER